MKILSSVKNIFSNDVINKWEKRTGQFRNKVKQIKYLSSKENGKPKNISEEKNWSIRDCILNHSEVQKYMNDTLSFRGDELEEKQKKYNGYKFYQFVFLNNTKECPLIYLNTYAIFLDFKDFKEYIEKCSLISDIDRRAQLELIKSEEDNTNLVRDIEIFKKSIKNYNIPNHFLGFYKGYIAKSGNLNESEPIGLLTEISLLIADTGMAYVRSLDLENKGNFLKNYYEGTCYFTNSFTMHIECFATDKDNNTFEIVFVLYTQSAKYENIFLTEKVLKSSFTGTDITTKLPNEGRLIFKLEKNWGELLKNQKPKEEIFKNFLIDKVFKPSELNKSATEKLLKIQPNLRNLIREFFTIEDKRADSILTFKNFINGLT